MSKDNIYDYVITLPETPAFLDNIEIMLDRIVSDGNSPTIKMTRVNHGTEEEPEYEDRNLAHPQPGTKFASGKIMLHFRLNDKYGSSAELITYLRQGMTNPKPPITVQLIRSGFKIVWVSDGVDPEGEPIGHYEYDEIIAGSKSQFLPYMNDVPDGAGGARPPNASDDLYLSGYYDTEPTELI